MDVKVNGLDNLERIGREFPKASARALNKTMRHVRTQMVKDARSQYKASSADLKKAAGNVSGAMVRRLIASFRVKGKRMPLVKFVTASLVRRSLEQKGKKIQRRAKITATITRGKKAIYPQAFAATMKSGHTGIFWRKQGSRKISEVSAVSPPQMFSGAWSRILQVIDVRKKLQETLAHEIEWEMTGKRSPTSGDGE